MADDAALKVWYGLRTKTIHERVTAHDLLRRNGISFRHTGDREEQFSCPFHGKDESPSARIYPANARSPSHVWCFVCRERWDVIALWKKYNGGEDKSFHRTLSEIEKYYGIIPPPVPEGGLTQIPTVDESSRNDYERLYEACERRLRDVRTDYVRLNDMNGYLVAGSILDKLSHQVNEGNLSPKEGLAVLQKLLQKVGERIRRVSPDQVADT